MPVAVSTFRWTNAYSVNIADLDRQHQKLFETMNELDQALRRGQGKAALDPILEKLADYAHVHFAAEESLMEDHSFPGLAPHRAEHDAFREKIALFLAQHKAGKSGVPVSLLLFVQGWLKQHLQNTDKKYTAFLNARGVQ